MDVGGDGADLVFGFEEGFDDDGVEVFAGTLLYDGDGFVEGHRGFVDALGNEGIENVGDGHDAGGKRDLLAFEAFGVAFAVPFLVVVVGHVLGLAEVVFLEGVALDGLFDSAYDLGAFRGVGLHYLELFGGELAGLVEDRVGDLDLADVVHRG